MIGIVKTLQFIFAGGRVKRYHTHDTLLTQNNAEHSWGVVTLLLMLKPDASIHAIKYALWHDVAEIETGDIPATAKWRWPSLQKAIKDIEKEMNRRIPLLSEISDEEKALIKVCDRLESMIHCVREKKLGNTGLDQIIKNQMQKVDETQLYLIYPELTKILVSIERNAI